MDLILPLVRSQLDRLVVGHGWKLFEDVGEVSLRFNAVAGHTLNQLTSHAASRLQGMTPTSALIQDFMGRAIST